MNGPAQMVRFSYLFYGLPMHVIINCQEKAEKDEATGAIHYAPLLWGQSDVEVGSYAFLVARLVHRAVLSNAQLKTLEDPAQKESGAKITSVALFTPTGKYDAKDQYHMGIDFMADPTMTKMLDLIWPDGMPSVSR